MGTAGNLYNASATVGRFTSYFDLSGALCLACFLVVIGVLLATTKPSDKSDDSEENRPLVGGLVIGCGVLVCVVGILCFYATHKSKHVAAFAGFSSMF